MKINSIINKYKIIEILRENEHSITGVCLDIKLNKEWFIKYINYDHQSEIDNLLKIENTRVPNVIDVIKDKEGIYYIMDYIKGVSIIEYIINQHISLYEFKNIIISLVGILENIHANGIVHGDIKSDNILIDLDNIVHLIDFGSSFSEKDSNSYTLKYVAPERLTDFFVSDERSDIYSFGVLLEEMLIYYKKVTRFSIKRYLLFRKLNKVIRKSKKIDPENRYQSIAYIKEDLYRF